MSAQEDTFISHLVELRDRLLRAVVAIAVAFVCLMPWAGEIYDILAHPMMQALPEGTRMIATGLGLPLVIGSTILFLAGMAFCYFFVFGTVFKFIAQFAPKSITPAPDIEQYLAFVMSMFLAFGITFEVPVFVIVLVKLGVVDVPKLKEARPYVIVGAFIVAAVVTPPDVVSQLALAIPM